MLWERTSQPACLRRGRCRAIRLCQVPAWSLEVQCAKPQVAAYPCRQAPVAKAPAAQAGLLAKAWARQELVANISETGPSSTNRKTMGPLPRQSSSWQGSLGNLGPWDQQHSVQEELRVPRVAWAQALAQYYVLHFEQLRG